MAERAITVRIIGDPSSLERAFGRAAASAKTFDEKMTAAGASASKFGASMTRNVTLPLAAVGAASVKLAMTFDQTMSRLVGLAGVTQKQADAWRKTILAMSPQVGKGPDELANALYQVASAGVKGKRAIDAVRVSAQASAAGMGDTATVADAVTSAMNAYAKSGLTAKQAVDVLSAAVRDGKGEASQFAPVIGKVVAVAAQLGVSFDQVGGALAQMTKLGVPAEDAATQLSATFSGLLKTTPRAEKALEAMGLSAAGLRQELADKGLLATLQTLAEKTKGSSVAMAEAFPNVRALRGILQLVGSAAQGTAQVFADTKNSTNSLSTAFGAASKTEAFKMQQSLAQLKVAAINLGETLAPVATKIAGDIAHVAKAFDNLSPAEKKVAVRLAEVVAIAGPTIMVGGKLITMVGALAKAFGILAGSEAAAAGAATTLRGRLIALGPATAFAAAAGAALAFGARGETQSGGPPGSVSIGHGLHVDPKTGHYVAVFNGQTIDGGPAPHTGLPGVTNVGSSAAEAAGSPRRSSQSTKPAHIVVIPVNNALAPAGGGGGSTYNPLAGAGGGGGSKKKASIIEGPALLSNDLRNAISRAAAKAGASKGSTAIGYLDAELLDLAKAHKELAAKLAGSTGKQRDAIKAEMVSVENRIDAAHKSIRENLKAQGDAIKQSFASKISTQRSAISSTVGKLQQEMDQAFEKATQHYVDTVLGPQFFQGTDAHGMGRQTPLEKQLAEMTAADTTQGLQDALDTAKKQLALDQADVSVTAEQLAADQKAIDQAQRAIDENDLAIRATAERAQADHDYAIAVQNYQDQRSLLEQQMNDRLDTWGKNLAAGTATIGGLNDIATTFGFTLADITDPKTGIGVEFSNLATQVTFLSATLQDEAQALKGLATSITSGLGGTDGYRLLNPQRRMAAGGIVTSPTVALIGEAGPEAVVPLSGAGRGLGALMTVVLEMDSREVGRKTLPYQAGEVRVTLR